MRAKAVRPKGKRKNKIEQKREMGKDVWSQCWVVVEVKAELPRTLPRTAQVMVTEVVLLHPPWQRLQCGVEPMGTGDAAALRRHLAIAEVDACEGVESELWYEGEGACVRAMRGVCLDGSRCESEGRRSDGEDFACQM